MNLDGILKIIEEKGILAVRFEQTDMYGVARSKTIPACYFKEKATEGINFVLCGLAMDIEGRFVEGTGYGEEIGYGDGVAFPDLETFRVLPWLGETARILVEPTWNGEFVPAYPRVVARKQLDHLNRLGISLLTAHEHEFCVFYRDSMKRVHNDLSGLSTIAKTPIRGLLNKILKYLPQVGVSIETIHSEGGAGVMEITYKPEFGIRAADNAHTYKTSIKEIALIEGYVATFMTNPLSNQGTEYEGGCAAHLCHSLWDAEGKLPLLYDPSNVHNLSHVGQHWIAGLLAHAPALQVLMAPTVNCLREYDLETMAPANSTWGVDNRTCLLRVKINGGKGTYLEYRAGRSACNPYLSLAAAVAAGVDGFINKLELPSPVTGSAFCTDNVPRGTTKLPTNMEEALRALNDDKIICDALGHEFIRCFSSVKKREATLAREAMSCGNQNWQRDCFLPL